MSRKKIAVVLYGGRSVEHEVSCRSAKFVLSNIDINQFDVTAIGVDGDGTWHIQPSRDWRKFSDSSVPIVKSATKTSSTYHLDIKSPFEAFARLCGISTEAKREDIVVFPVIHGTGGEDGSLQGFLELAQVAYVGPDLLGSAVGMDKIIAKKLVSAAGIAIVPYVETNIHDWKTSKEEIYKKIQNQLSLPVFVKPAALGSSVGVAKVRDWKDLIPAIEAALTLDSRVLIEKGLSVREIECAALGYDQIEITTPGEVVLNSDFYSYSAKYQDALAAKVAIPADLSPEQINLAKQISHNCFRALCLNGMARIDLFLEIDSGKFFFNEVNTIPGFTEISQYPLLWKNEGVSSEKLISRLLDVARARQEFKNSLARSATTY